MSEPTLGALVTSLEALTEELLAGLRARRAIAVVQPLVEQRGTTIEGLRDLVAENRTDFSDDLVERVRKVIGADDELLRQLAEYQSVLGAQISQVSRVRNEAAEPPPRFFDSKS